MAFKLKSGNKPTFKMMGSSPLKSHDGTKSTTTHYADGSPKSEREVDFSKRHEGEVENSKTTIKKTQPGLENSDKDAAFDKFMNNKDVSDTSTAFDKFMNNKDWMPGPPKPPPPKPKTGSGADSTEGQDENKIFDDKGNHIGNWKGDKKVLFKESPAKHGTTSDFHYGKNGHNPDIMDNKHEDWHAVQATVEKQSPKSKRGTGDTRLTFKEATKKQAKKIVDTVKSGPSVTKSPAKHVTFKSHIHPDSGGSIQTVKAKKTKTDAELQLEMDKDKLKNERTKAKNIAKNKKREERTARKKARKEKRQKRRAERKKGWKVKVGNVTAGNTTNPVFDKKD